MPEENIQETELMYQSLMKQKIERMKAEELQYAAEKKKEEELAAQKTAVEKQELAYQDFKDRFIKEMKLDSSSPIGGSGSDVRVVASGVNSEMLQFQTYHKKFLEQHGIEKSVAYGSDYHIGVLEGNFAYTDSDSGCVDVVDDWVPADYYCSMIWQAKQNFGYLAGKVTVRGCDINAGNGGVAQIRVVGARTSVTTLTMSQGCTCVSCLSNTWTTYSTTVDVLADYTVLCDIDVFKAGTVLKPAVIEAMSRNLARELDNRIYYELYNAIPGYTQTLAAVLDCNGGLSGSCCSLASNLYESIIALEATMREAGYFDQAKPVLIISPTVAAILKYKDTPSAPAWMNSQVQVSKGQVITIGNIDVIEYPDAISCAATSALTLCLLIDPTRAVSEIYGKRPTFKMDYDPIECFSTKIVAAMWVAVDELDTGAIGHIVSP